MVVKSAVFRPLEYRAQFSFLPLGWQIEAVLPHPYPLPLEREPDRPRFAKPNACSPPNAADNSPSPNGPGLG